MRIINSIVIIALLGVIGCSSSPSVSQAAKPKEADITGKWSGKLEVPKTATDDPAAKLAESMVDMFGEFVLEFKAGDRYTLTVMGMPTEGAYVRAGSNLTLNPEKIMGMTVEEAKKEAAKAGRTSSQDPGAPIKGSFSADATTLTLDDNSGSKGSLVFHRKVEKPKVVGAATATSEEANLVGSYTGVTDPSKAKPDELQMLKAMDGNLKLVLDKDNTFVLNMMMEGKGKWSVKGDILSLKATEMSGVKASPEDKPLTFKIKGTKLVPIDGGKEAPFSFNKD